jgi:Putative transmembrane protein (PGPGW)
MRKLIVALIGGTVLLVGIALLVLPGPGIPIVLAGIAILASEFVWARRALKNAKDTATKAARRWPGFDAWLRRRRHPK